MIVVATPPPGISPRPSPTVHSPPIDRTLSVPLNVSGGLSGAMLASISDVHSPTSFCSHSCSFCGSACIAFSFPRCEQPFQAPARPSSNRFSAAGNGPDDEVGLLPRRHGVRQRGVRRLVGQVLLAGEEPQQRPPQLRHVVADRPAQHRVAGFQRVEDRALRRPALDLKLYLALDLRQRPQMIRQHHSNHDSVCTSTDSTDGRWDTIGAHLSPPSADPYTCPPVVPKYTPHGSSASTAIASRSTLT